MNRHFEKNLVSVMMPAYNAEAYIAEAIESVLAQTYEKWELLIVNDGSKDKTGEIAASFDDPRIRLIHQENGGEASARNTALANLCGEFLAFLDADDAFLPEHLEKTAVYLQNHPEKDAVYTDGIYITSAGERLQPLSSQRRGPFSGWIFPEVVRASDVFGPPTCTLLRTHLIFEHDLIFDTRIVIGPDWDFLTRYCEWAQFGNLSHKTVLYRVHETNITVTVDLKRRAGYMALCREKAIHLDHFADCPLEVQTAVFYDLLVNLLADTPDRQTAVSQWPQFQALPATEQANLFRLMASTAVLSGAAGEHIASWYQQSRLLSPHDKRNSILSTLYAINPKMCLTFLKARSLTQTRKQKASPFANLNQ